MSLRALIPVLLCALLAPPAAQPQATPPRDPQARALLRSQDLLLGTA